MSNRAETYERYMTPALFRPWASLLVQDAVLKREDRVLDLACGTGVVARLAAAEVQAPGKVVGLDLNPDMLEVARTAATKEGLRIDWQQGRAESLPFSDASFDVVLCQEALQFMEDRQRALAEVRRVLAPGGRFLLSVWQSLDRHPFYRTIHEAILARLGMSGLQDIFGLGDPDRLRSMLTTAGFQDVQIEPVSMVARFPDPAAFIAGEIDTAAIPSMQHLDARERAAITAAIREDMEATLDEATENDRVVIPFHAHVVRAERPDGVNAWQDRPAEVA